MIYFTSDTHFNHDRAFIWEPRGFGSIAESNQTLFDNWNAVVSSDDDVYMLGDFFLGIDLKFIQHTLDHLNGKIYLIRGNHDTNAKMDLYRNSNKVVEIADALWFDYRDRHFYLSHYPTLTANLNDSPETAVFNLHGHTHSKKRFYEDRPYMYNVAVDAQGNKPVSIDQIMSEIDKEIETCKLFLV